VTCSARAELIVIARQRQVHGETRHAIALDRDGSVMAGRVRIEEREQQRLGEQTAERDAACDVAVERLATGDHEERADALREQLPHGAHQRVHRIRRRCGRFAPQSPDRDLVEEPAQVFLEDDHQHQHQDGEEALEDPHRHLEFELAREEEGGAGDRDTGQRDPGACASQPRQRGPQRDGHERDVDEVRQANALCNLELEQCASRGATNE
jgi:hypothetical protein